MSRQFDFNTVMVVRSELWILIVAQLSDMAPGSGVFFVGGGAGGEGGWEIKNKPKTNKQ